MGAYVEFTPMVSPRTSVPPTRMCGGVPSVPGVET